MLTRVRVAGPFTVESVSVHRTLAIDWNDELIDKSERATGCAETRPGFRTEETDPECDSVRMGLENFKAAGVWQAAKEGRIAFTALARLAGPPHLRQRHMHGERHPAPGRQALSAPSSAPCRAPIPRGRPSRSRRCGGLDVLIGCAFN